MKTKILVIGIVVICAILVAGCAVAETVMYPDDGYENVSVNITNNTTANNSTNASVTVHKEPRGIFHRIVYHVRHVTHVDPFIHPDKYGVVTYHNALWVKDFDGDWVKVAKLNNQNQIIEEYMADDGFLRYIITRNHSESSDCTYYYWDLYMINNDELMDDMDIDDLNDTNITNLVNNDTTVDNLMDDSGDNSIGDSGDVNQENGDDSGEYSNSASDESYSSGSSSSSSDTGSME